MTESSNAQSVTAFIAYAREDESRLNELHKHLSLLRRRGKISLWYDRRIEPGQEWESAIDAQIETANVILLLVSADFLDSDYCYGKELAIAMRRHEASEARVVPIIVRPCDWSGAPFRKIQALPKDGQPVSTWADPDSAWTDVAKGLRRVVEGSDPPTAVLERPPDTSPPLSPGDARATIKRLLPDRAAHIRISDLVTEEAEKIRTRITSDPTFFQGPGLSGEEIAAQLPRLESISAALTVLLANGCYWGGAWLHGVWVRALNRLADVPLPDRRAHTPGRNVALYRYPAMLGLYAGGIAAVAAARYDTLAALLTGSAIDDGYGRQVPLVIGLNPYAVLSIEAAETMPGQEGGPMPFNRRICSLPILREAVRGLLLRDSDFDATLDRFEYLLGLVHWDLSEQIYQSGWAPVSCFVWRDHNRFWEPSKMPVALQIASELEAQREGWGPLTASLFGGSVNRAGEVAGAYNASIPNRPH